jgi:hypothetical protein
MSIDCKLGQRIHNSNLPGMYETLGLARALELDVFADDWHFSARTREPWGDFRRRVSVLARNARITASEGGLK